MLVVEVDGAERAAGGTLADLIARGEAGEAVEVLAVGGKGVDVLEEGLVEVVAGLEIPDLVVACSGGVGAGAHEDL